MTAEQRTQNHYQVLGIDRSADERAIKKAYFAAIRKCPPDTHPEEFKRLREAYEVLNDPVARERFDSAERDYLEYGDDAAVALKEAEEAVKAGDESTAQAKLSALVDARPDLTVAREQLAASLSRTKAFKEALEHLDVLVEQAPEQARFHLFRGITLRSLEKPKKARRALQEAHRLAPDDLGIHLVYVDLLAHEKAWDDALAELDAAAEHQKPGSKGALRVALRRIDVLALASDRKGRDDAITELLDEVQSAADPELTRHVSSQLAAVAAGCFVRKEPMDANAILRRCEEIYPESMADHPFPARAELPVDALPEPARAWLGKLVPGDLTVRRAAGISPMVVALLAIGWLSLIVLLSFGGEPSAWVAVDAVMAGLALAGGVFALSHSGRNLLLAARSQIGAFLTLHPLYLIDTEPHRVFLYPLVGLGDVRAVHHHTNGFYTHTAVSMQFGEHSVHVSLHGREYAERWVGTLIGQRNRTLELMMEGYLEAEHGVDLIPPALLTTPEAGREGGRAAPTRRWYLGTAAAVLAVWGVVAIAHPRSVDEQLWRAAVREGTAEAYRTYPASGRHAAEAQREMARVQASVTDALRAVTDPRAPLAAALRDAVGALQAAGATRVPLVLTIDGRPASEDQVKSFVADLGSIFSAAGLEKAIELVPQATAGTAVVSLFVSVGSDCTASLTIPGSAQPWSAPLDRGPSAPAKPLGACARQLAGALGLGGLAAAVQNRRAQAEHASPYHGASQPQTSGRP